MGPTPINGPDRGRIRLRAAVAGVALAALLCYVSVYSTLVHNVTNLSLEYCIPGAILFILVLSCGINPILKLIDRRWLKAEVLAFRPAELGVVFLSLALGSGLVTWGFAEMIVPMVAGGAYFGDTVNQWPSIVAPHTADWMALNDTHTARCFFEGVEPGAEAPWKPWLVPLGAWSIFAVGYFATSIALMVLMRRQWMEDERLTFPIAQAPLALIAEPEKDKLFPRIMRSRLMWLGAAVPLIITSWNAVATIQPVLGRISLNGQMSLFSQMIYLKLHFSFVVCGFAYLLSTEVSLSLWLFNLLYAVQTGLFRFIGFSLGKPDPFSHLDPSVTHQATGGMFVLILSSLWVARKRLREAFRCAWRPDPAIEDPEGIMTYRWCLIVLIAGVGVMLGWLWMSGMAPHIALLYLIIALGTIYFLARTAAQAGLPAARPVLIPQAILAHGIGTSALSETGMVSLAYTMGWSADVRTSVMASTANGLYALRGAAPAAMTRRRNRRMVLIAIAATILVCLIVSYIAIIGLAYRHGGMNTGTWVIRSWPLYTQRYAAELLTGGIEASGQRWAFTGLGGLVMAGLLAARRAFIWWPIHPIGFVLGASSPVQWSWTGIFAAWLVKSLFIKYGGPRLYIKGRDIFLGFVIGQILSAGIWLVLATIFHLPNVRVPIL